MTQPLVFISYSHKDEAEKEKLRSHLGVLGKTGLIDLWSDDRIGAGSDSEPEIRQAMAQAKVAILLVTANFLTSDFILDEEVPTLLQRREREGLKVFPVIARACAWRKVDWLARMNVRPKNGRPVWSDVGIHVDEDLTVIAEEVAAIVEGTPYTGPGVEPPPSVPLQRPPRAPHFTGRETELAQLLARLQPGQVVTLCGPGGVGKTALAAEAIWTLAPGDDPPERFPDGIIFYSFYGRPDVALAFQYIVRSFDETALDTSPAATYRLLSRKRALLILDGVENADDLAAVLDVAGGCGVLITSRRHADAPIDWEDVKPLPNPQAVELLQAWGGDCAADEAAAQRICPLVGALPLAVYLAGRYMAQRGQEAAEYLEWLEKTPLVALHFGDRQRESAQVLMERSAAQLSQSARAALGVAGTLALASFDRAAVAAALEVSVPAAGRALGELVDYGLLLRNEEGRYQPSHALVHTYARRRLAPRVEVIERLAAYYNALAKEQSALELEGYVSLDAERPHLIGVLERCVGQEAWEAALGLAAAADNYLDTRGYWVERVTASQAGLAAARGLEHRRDEAAFLGSLGLAYGALGQVERAIEYHQQALAIARENCAASKERSAEWADARRGEGAHLGNLGNAYAELGQVERAIEYHQQALVIAREIGDRRGEGADLGNLGNAYHDLGQLERAAEYHKLALAIHRENCAASTERSAEWVDARRGEGLDLGNLGHAYYHLGQVKHSIGYYEQALGIAREIGDRHSEGIWLDHLGLAYRDLGQVEEARDCIEQALAIFEKIKSPGAEQARRDLGSLETSDNTPGLEG